MYALVLSWKDTRGNGFDTYEVCRLDDVNQHCLTEFRKHWECLDNNNQQLWQCRRWERPLNKCVFDNLVRFFCTPLSWFSLAWEAVLMLCFIEAGEEDPGCAQGRGAGARAQEADLRAFHHDAVEGVYIAVPMYGSCGRTWDGLHIESSNWHSSTLPTRRSFTSDVW